MTTRSDVDRLSAANRGIVRMARNDLEALFAGMDLSDPEHVAGVLSDAVPALVREYGNLAAAVADDWYEEVRIAAGAPGTYRAQLSDGADPAAVLGSTKTGLSGLFEGDGAKSLAFLSAAMQRHISYSTRDTIRRNVATDPARPRYARVPSGAKTCAWCEMLASRGFVYVTKKTAGEDESWHDECVVGDTRVSGPQADVGYRRWFKGEIVTLVTAAGHELTITPNHPVLTDRGWVKAGLLNEGDQLVSAISANWNVSDRPDEDHVPPRIEDLVSALGMMDASTRLRVPPSAQQFHGDWFDSEVDVISRNDLFRDEVDPTFGEPVPELDFGGGAIPCPSGSEGCSGGSHFELSFAATDDTEGGGVRGLGLSESVVGSHLAGPELPGFCGGSRVHTGLNEPSIDHTSSNAVMGSKGKDAFSGHKISGKVGRRWDSSIGWTGAAGPSFDPPEFESRAESAAAYAKLGADLFERLSGLVHLDCLVEKRVGEFEGHVFNLSTCEGWYSANHITVSNCDCQIVADFDAENAHIDGYDPDAMYERYREAYMASDGTTKGAAAYMRRMHPEQYTDGVRAPVA